MKTDTKEGNGTMATNKGKTTEDTSSSSSVTAAAPTPTPAAPVTTGTPNKPPVVEWEEVKKARNRINSQRTRERERDQIKALESDRSRLWLSNDALQFQNQHYRDIIAQILDRTTHPRTQHRSGGTRTIVPGTTSQTVAAAATAIPVMPSSANPAAIAAAAAAAPAVQFNNSINNNTNNNKTTTNPPMGTMPMMNGLDQLFGSSRLPTAATTVAAASSFNGLSDADLLARHHPATAQEMQLLLMRQQAAAAMGGMMGGGNMVGGGGMPMGSVQHMNNTSGIHTGGLGAPSSGGGGIGMGNNNDQQHRHHLNMNTMDMNNMDMTNMNMNTMNMNNMNGYTNTTRTLAGMAPSPFTDVAENIRLRQLMLQQSAAFEGGAGNGEALGNTMGMIQNNMTGGGGGGGTSNSGMLTGIRAASVAAPGIGGLGDFGNNGITANATIANVQGGGSSNNNGVSGDSNMLQINKRQKLGL